jgi:hypothetical protein
LASVKDQLRKTVVVFYEIDPDAEAPYQRLHDAFGGLRTCARVWHLEAAGAVRDAKCHAGAGTLVKRKGIALTTGAVPYLKTNIEIPTIPVGKQLLAFLPERLLVFDSHRVGAVPYAELMVGVTQIRFIEDGAVPDDAQVIDRTWKYVNKKGTPDRRFKDNRELPVVQYEELHFFSGSGLNEKIQLSRAGVGEPFRLAVAAIAAQRQAVDSNTV